MLVSSSLAPPEGDILKSDVRAGGERGGDSFAAAGEKESIADFSEELVVVDMDRGIGGIRNE